MNPLCAEIDEAHIDGSRGIFGQAQNFRRRMRYIDFNAIWTPPKEQHERRIRDLDRRIRDLEKRTDRRV